MANITATDWGNTVVVLLYKKRQKQIKQLDTYKIVTGVI